MHSLSSYLVAGCLTQVDESTLALHLWPPGSCETGLQPPTAEPQQVQPSAGSQDGAGTTQQEGVAAAAGRGGETAQAPAAAGLEGIGSCAEAARGEKQGQRRQQTFTAEKKQRAILVAIPSSGALRRKPSSSSPEELVRGCSKRRQSATKKVAITLPAAAEGVATSTVATLPHLQGREAVVEETACLEAYTRAQWS